MWPTDPTQECTPYYYAPSANLIHNFPTIWQPATILPTDTAAQAKWASISSSVPTNIQPRGTAMGDFSNVTYDTVNDPACCECLFSSLVPFLPSAVVLFRHRAS